MHRYWTRVVAPLLGAAKPGAIVEIGSGDGVVTRRLLELTRPWAGTVHAIDPLPRFPADEWEREYGDRFQLYRDLSRNALPGIACADAYLIDGDHNWYTVREELALIGRAARMEAGRPFPLVFLRETGWPYARRDRYHDPRTIPEDRVQRFRRGGLLPDRPEPAGGDGLAPEDIHSIREGEPGTGVLTALEDFLQESPFELAVFRAPAFRGLAVIAGAAAASESSDLGRLLTELHFGPLAGGLLEDVERARVDAEIAFTAASRQHTDAITAGVAASLRHAREMQDQMRDRARETKILQGRHARELRQTKRKNERKIADLREQIATLKAQKAGLQRKLAERAILARFRSGANARVAGHALGWLAPGLVRAFLRARDRGHVRELVDAAWYRATYPDVAASGADPADHYVALGVFEGRDPRADFSTTDYLLDYPDVAADGINPLLHYARKGASEGRKTVPARKAR